MKYSMLALIIIILFTVSAFSIVEDLTMSFGEYEIPEFYIPVRFSGGEIELGPVNVFGYNFSLSGEYRVAFSPSGLQNSAEMLSLNLKSSSFEVGVGYGFDYILSPNGSGFLVSGKYFLGNFGMGVKYIVGGGFSLSMFGRLLGLLELNADYISGRYIDLGGGLNLYGIYVSGMAKMDTSSFNMSGFFVKLGYKNPKVYEAVLKIYPELESGFPWLTVEDLKKRPFMVILKKTLFPGVSVPAGGIPIEYRLGSGPWHKTITIANGMAILPLDIKEGEYDIGIKILTPPMSFLRFKGATDQDRKIIETAKSFGKIRGNEIHVFFKTFPVPSSISLESKGGNMYDSGFGYHVLLYRSGENPENRYSFNLHFGVFGKIGKGEEKILSISGKVKIRLYVVIRDGSSYKLLSGEDAKEYVNLSSYEYDVSNGRFQVTMNLVKDSDDIMMVYPVMTYYMSGQPVFSDYIMLTFADITKIAEQASEDFGEDVSEDDVMSDPSYYIESSRRMEAISDYLADNSISIKFKGINNLRLLGSRASKVLLRVPKLTVVQLPQEKALEGGITSSGVSVYRTYPGVHKFKIDISGFKPLIMIAAFESDEYTFNIMNMSKSRGNWASGSGEVVIWANSSVRTFSRREYGVVVKEAVRRHYIISGAPGKLRTTMDMGFKESGDGEYELSALSKVKYLEVPGNSGVIVKYPGALADRLSFMFLANGAVMAEKVPLSISENAEYSYSQVGKILPDVKSLPKKMVRIKFPTKEFNEGYNIIKIFGIYHYKGKEFYVPIGTASPREGSIILDGKVYMAVIGRDNIAVQYSEPLRLYTDIPVTYRVFFMKVTPRGVEGEIKQERFSSKDIKQRSGGDYYVEFK